MDAQKAAVAAPETDALLNLEERILRAVELVTSLRSEKKSLLGEKSQLLAEKQALEDELSSARRQTAEVERELSSLRDDREHVKTRIESLLGQMDALGDA